MIQCRTFKLKASLPDWRDLNYVPTGKELREQVDLRQWASPVEDQYNLGSCASNATVSAYELLTIKDFPEKFKDLSRLFVYYNTRRLEGTVDEDAGAYIRETIRAVRLYGICTEELWPYNVEKFAIEPTPVCYQDAKSRNIKDYFRITTVENMLDSVNNDIPVVIGILIYSSFDNLTKENPILETPTETRWSAIGGHAMTIVGYDLPKSLFLVRNSFGPSWCLDGYCWITFDYIKTQLLDSWVYNIELLDTVEDKYYT